MWAVRLMNTPIESTQLSKTRFSPLSLRTNVSWAFVGNAIYAGSQWGLIVVLAKLTSPLIVGRFALALAVTTPVMMFSTLNLRSVQATDVKQAYSFSDYLGLRLLTAPIAWLVIAIIAMFSGYGWATFSVVCVVGLAKGLETISGVYYGLFQLHERLDLIAKSMIIKGVLSLVGLSLGVYLTNDLFWGAIGMAAAWALLLLSFDLPMGRQILRSTPHPPEGEPSLGAGEASLRPRWDMSTLARLTWLALPLGLVVMLISLGMNIPRYLIEAHIGEYQLGIFAAIASLQKVGYTAVTALGQSATPRMAKHASRDIRRYRALLAKLLLIGLVLGIMGVVVAFVAGRAILTLLFQPDYARPDLLVLTMSAAGFEYLALIYGYALTAVRKFKVQLPLYASVTILTFLVCTWLIPRGGLVGAAIALNIVGFVKVASSVLVLNRSLHAESNKER